jgi:dCMP deaminase
LNAILNASTSVAGCVLFSTLFPCNECCKAIIQAGIKKIVYLSDKYAETITVHAGKKMLNFAGVEFRPYEGKCENIILPFN